MQYNIYARFSIYSGNRGKTVNHFDDKRRVKTRAFTDRLLVASNHACWRERPAWLPGSHGMKSMVILLSVLRWRRCSFSSLQTTSLEKTEQSRASEGKSCSSDDVHFSSSCCSYSSISKSNCNAFEGRTQIRTKRDFLQEGLYSRLFTKSGALVCWLVLLMMTLKALVLVKQNHVTFCIVWHAVNNKSPSVVLEVS